MAGNKDFIEILRSIRGSAAPGETATDGIWYELTQANTNGNAGIYGDILAKYGVVVDNTATLDQAVAIIDGLTVVANELNEGSAPTAQLVGTTLTLGIPKGTTGQIGAIGATGPRGLTGLTGAKGDKGDTGATGADGHTPTEQEVDAIVSANVNVQAAQTLLDDAIVQAETELTTLVDNKEVAYNANALNRLTQYNYNHVSKLTAYNTNDATKLSQYNANHIESLENINYAYADRIVQMLKTKRIMGMVDEYVAQTEEHMIPFLSTDDANYIYYANGALLTENVDYTVYDSKTIELTVKANPYDVIVQLNTQVLHDMLAAEGVLFDYMLGQPNGVASLNGVGQVPVEQLPSYVDDVLEFPTYADLPIEGESGKIYVVPEDETSGGNTSSYRWTGTTYAMVSNTLTAEDIKALYESNSNTNAYTDAEKAKLDALETSAQLDARDVANRDRANHTGTQLASTISDFDTAVRDSTQVTLNTTKLIGIEDGATADQNAEEIEALYESNLNTNKYTDAEKTKLDGIEEGATADQTATEIEALYESNIDTNKYTDAEKSSVDIAIALTTTAQTLPTAVNELDNRVADIEDNTTLAEYGIADAYTKTEVDNFIDVVESSIDSIDVEISNLVDEVALKAYADNAILTGEPKAPTAAVGDDTTQVATTAFVGAEIADKAYSKTQLDAGQLDNRYYTETELDNGALDSRYYTETEIDTKLAEQNDAIEISYDGTVSGLVATNVQDAIDEVEDRLDIVEGTVSDVNLTRADKYLASKNIARLIYEYGNLTKIRYNIDSDVDYEVLTYSGEDLVNVAHYIDEELKGNTVLTYASGELVSSIFIGV